MEGEGYACSGVNLPGNSDTPYKDGRLIAIGDDIEAVQQTVLSQLDSGNNVVVVTRSCGSIPSTAALTDLNTIARKAAGKSTSVTGVVIIAGFLLPPETTMLAVMGGDLPSQYLHGNDATPPFNGPGAIHGLYNDVPHNKALKAVWRPKPQSFGINTGSTPDQVAGLRGIPLSYLLCDNDNAVPWDAQRDTVTAFKGAGIETHAEVASSCHSPFLKLPKETARFSLGERLGSA